MICTQITGYLLYLWLNIVRIIRTLVSNWNKFYHATSLLNLRLTQNSPGAQAIRWNARFGVLSIETDKECLSLLEWYHIRLDLLKSEAIAHA